MEYLTESELSGLSPETRKELDAVLVRAENKIIEKVLCSIPDMVVHLARRQQMMQDLYEDLFKKLPEDAKKDKELLAAVIQKTEMANPGLAPDKLFEKIPAEYAKAKSAYKQIPGAGDNGAI